MKTITVKADTRLKDLKAGDLVMTAELMRVVKVRRGNRVDVVNVKPQCRVCGQGCTHEFIRHIGWGQHGIVKVIERERR